MSKQGLVDSLERAGFGVGYSCKPGARLAVCLVARKAQGGVVMGGGERLRESLSPHGVPEALDALGT